MNTEPESFTTLIASPWPLDFVAAPVFENSSCSYLCPSIVAIVGLLRISYTYGVCMSGCLLLRQRKARVSRFLGHASQMLVRPGARSDTCSSCSCSRDARSKAPSKTNFHILRSVVRRLASF
ncbi:hypothetical protein CCMA1212_004539 [Trichoderma ghanense]|uniref:Uncharacterized protein n=1 Tax=Trichoderma ghanense TaxID=65468 RepID=A0ABY2H5H3_9HYPO